MELVLHVDTARATTCCCLTTARSTSGGASLSTNGHCCSQLLMLLLQYLKLFLVVLRIDWIGCQLSRCWLGVATAGTDARALAETLGWVLGQLLL